MRISVLAVPMASADAGPQMNVVYVCHGRLPYQNYKKGQAYQRSSRLLRVENRSDLGAIVTRTGVEIGIRWPTCRYKSCSLIALAIWRHTNPQKSITNYKFVINRTRSSFGAQDLGGVCA